MLRAIRLAAVVVGLVLIVSGIYAGRIGAVIVGLIVAAVNARQLWRERAAARRGDPR